MEVDKDFFKSDVEFVSVGEALVENEHPALEGNFWSLKPFLGLVGGCFLFLSSTASATDFRVTPMEAAAAERRADVEAQHVLDQDLDGLYQDALALLKTMNTGGKTGDAGLRSVTISKFGPGSQSKDFDEAKSDLAAVHFIVGAK